MGVPVLIMGESGSGKTYSIKNMNPDEVGIFLCEKNRLPFKKKFITYKLKNLKGEINGREVTVWPAQTIVSKLKNPNLKIYIIDDSQYLMANEYFDRASEQGYQKYTDIGVHFRDLIHFVNNELPDDVVVYFLHHTEMDANSGKTKAKTIGRMLDEKLTVEGLFDIVLRAGVEGSQHFFQTQSGGMDTAKSPEEMFPDARIPNDLKLVDDVIREYYELAPASEINKEPEQKASTGSKAGKSKASAAPAPAPASNATVTTVDKVPAVPDPVNDDW